MATLDSSEANILEAETINWRYIVYPLVAVVVLVVGGFSYYYSLVQQRNDSEEAARAALLVATTPEELIKVADQYPNTDNGTLALLTAAEDSFGKLDYAAAIKDYQRILDADGTAPRLHESAQIGLGSALEASGKLDEAASAYLAVARLGSKSPYAPYAYVTAARLYDQKGDKESERRILGEAVGLDAESPFVMQAKQKLKELNASAALPVVPPAGPGTTVTVPAVTPSATNAVPVMTPAAPKAPVHP